MNGGVRNAGLPPVNSKWKSGRYKYDARHWLGILLTMVAVKTCALFPSFAIACSMCLFKPMRGEYMRVVRHLRSTYSGITPKEISAKPWRYFRRMMRQVCPPPLVIMRGIKDVCEVYSHMTDPDTKRRFLNPDWRTVLKKQLKYVAQGLLSDNPALPLYWEIGKMASGFVVYRCLRTSSALEGYHAHLVRLVLHAYGAGQDWMDAIMNLFDFRWCVLAGRKAGLYDDAVRHFELELRDALQSALEALPFDVKRQLPKHRSVRAGVPRLRHGSYFSRKALQDNGEAAAAAASVDAPAGPTLPRRTWHTQATSADVAALLGSHNPTDAAALVEIALQRGLYWDVEEAQKFWQGGSVHRADEEQVPCLAQAPADVEDPDGGTSRVCCSDCGCGAATRPAKCPAAATGPWHHSARWRCECTCCRGTAAVCSGPCCRECSSAASPTAASSRDGSRATGTTRWWQRRRRRTGGAGAVGTRQPGWSWESWQGGAGGHEPWQEGQAEQEKCQTEREEDSRKEGAVDGRATTRRRGLGGREVLVVVGGGGYLISNVLATQC